MSFFSPEKCVECEKKCLDYQDHGSKTYTVDIKPTSGDCDNANALSAPNVKGGFYRFNRGNWFKRYLENQFSEAGSVPE
jgi:hypothetical protein